MALARVSPGVGATTNRGDAAQESISVAVIVPAHNEAAHIARVIATIPQFVDRIVVVDDASVDGTPGVVEGLDDPRVHLIRHATNTGVGGAMRTGYRFASANGYGIVVKMDADGQMLPAEMRRLVDPICLGMADYTKGNRFYLQGAAKSMPAGRGIGNTVLSFMTKVASGYWHVYDPQCGYTAIRGSFLGALDIDSIASDYLFENDMLIKLGALGAYVVDVPTSTVYGSEVSGVSILHVALTFPPRLLGAASRRFWRKHLVTDFGAVAVLSVGGAALVLFGVVFGGYHWWLSVVTGLASTTGTVMIAVLPIIVGIQAVLQAFAMTVTSSPGASETTQYARMLLSTGLLAANGEEDR